MAAMTRTARVCRHLGNTWRDRNQEAEDPTRGIRILGRVDISDGNSSPIESSYSLGAGGKGFIPKRD
jgi:hypothetical protein